MMCDVCEVRTGKHKYELKNGLRIYICDTCHDILKETKITNNDVLELYHVVHQHKKTKRK